jgi:hypothetical protein
MYEISVVQILTSWACTVFSLMVPRSRAERSEKKPLVCAF